MSHATTRVQERIGDPVSEKPPVTPARLDLASSTAMLARAQQQLGELELLTRDRRP